MNKSDYKIRIAIKILLTGIITGMMSVNINALDFSKYGIAESKLKTCIPLQAPPLKWAPSYHDFMLKNEPKNMQVMFLGDSITMYWQNRGGVENGSKIWEKYYKAVPAGNYGISGDKTEHILWRITEGRNLDGTDPEVILLLAGINNLYQGDSPEDTAAGIGAIMQVLRKRLPQSKILLLAVFPSKQAADDPMREKIKKVNAIIEKLADNRNIFFLDIGHIFLEKDGSMSQTIMRDYIHLSARGYARWAEAMNPHLFKLLKHEELKK